MYGQRSSADCGGSLTQIWACLAVERQARIIRLLAQLALNLVVAQSDGKTKECEHGPSSRCAQDPA